MIDAGELKKGITMNLTSIRSGTGYQQIKIGKVPHKSSEIAQN
jgi:hypothetical protein